MPPGEADDDQRQDGAENEPPVLRQRLQLVLQQRERERADDRPEEIGEAAEHGHEHELAGLRPVHQLRIGKADAEAEDRAADGAEARRDHESGEPKAADVHAEIFGLAGIVADGLEVQAERRMHDAPHQQAREHEQRQAVVVERPGQELDLVVLANSSPRMFMRGTRMPLSPPVRW